MLEFALQTRSRAACATRLPLKGLAATKQPCDGFRQCCVPLAPTTALSFRCQHLVATSSKYVFCVLLSRLEMGEIIAGLFAKAYCFLGTLMHLHIFAQSRLKRSLCVQ